MTATGAVLRLQHAARRQFARYGGVRPFQRQVATKDWDAGSESWAPSGAPVNAACHWDEITVRKAGAQGGPATVTLRERVLLVEIPAFAAAGGLTSDWSFVDFDDAEQRLASAVLSEDGTYYIARLGSGG